MLKDLTETKVAKVKASATISGIMGLPDSGKTVDTPDKRQLVRGFLNGLGFESKYYENLSYAELTTAWHSFSCVESQHMHRAGLVSMMVKSGDRDISEIVMDVGKALDRYNEITGFSSGRYEPDAPMVQRMITDHIQAQAGVPMPEPVKPAPVASTMSAEEIALHNAAIYERERANERAAPVPALAKAKKDETLEAAMALIKALSSPKETPAPVFDEAKVIALIEKHRVATEIKVTGAAGVVLVIPEMHHMALENVVKMVQAGINVLMVGPAGSGKTTIAEQCAKILGLEFYFNGALSSEYKLSGFVDANGKIVSTAFKRAYETGGLYLFDEIDASMPDALLAFNAALSNNHADFPEGMIPKHEKFVCVAAANTFGRGADRVYVGRNQLDGASLDRFCVINIEYDERLERALAVNDNWTDYVQAVRAAVFDLKIRHVVSPRASINGAKLLNQGLNRKFVEDSAIWKGLDADSVKKIKSHAGV